MFEIAVNHILKHEGEFTRASTDPGNWTGGSVGSGSLVGTKYGISAKAYPQLDIPNLTVAQAVAIYRRDYWTPMGCDYMTPSMALVVFDCAVNQGRGRAGDFLARSRSYGEFMAYRMQHYLSLRTLWPVYGRGWMIRFQDTLQMAAAMDKPAPEIVRVMNSLNKVEYRGRLVGDKVYRLYNDL